MTLNEAKEDAIAQSLKNWNKYYYIHPRGGEVDRSYVVTPYYDMYVKHFALKGEISECI